MIRTLVVDDEEHARNRLSFMLKDEDTIELVGVCKNGVEAIKEIEAKQPDLVFLDIEMPEVNGFDVISNLETDKMPIIIFVTAFSEYAVKAFEVNALDYIHKPFDKSRLKTAIERAERQMQQYDDTMVREKLKELLQDPQLPNRKLDRFILKSGGNIYIVKTDDVHWIEASGNYVNIVTEKKKHLMRSTLASIRNRLESQQFYQIHRSTIVNLDFVDHIEEWAYGDYKVVMQNGEELKMSRNYKELLKNI